MGQALKGLEDKVAQEIVVLTDLTEFYEIAFRTKVYEDIEGLQKDLDNWLVYYNSERPHQGKYCYGNTPLQTFEDAKKFAIEKSIKQSQ